MKRITTSSKIPHIKSADTYIKIAAILLWVVILWQVVNFIQSVIYSKQNNIETSMISIISFILSIIAKGVFAFFVSKRKKNTGMIIGTAVFAFCNSSLYSFIVSSPMCRRGGNLFYFPNRCSMSETRLLAPIRKSSLLSHSLPRISFTRV